MITIVAGSRWINSYADVCAAIQQSGFNITQVVSGVANGVDKLGERWARENGIAVKRFPANWRELGRGAGLSRNVEMGKYADALVAVWDGDSTGTLHMIKVARRLNLKTYVFTQEEL